MDIDVFISHHTETSLHIVEGIVNKLESNKIRCWYAPRNTEGSYASSIAKAINSCKVFLLILNRPASESVHVLNEIDMVTKRLSRNEDVKIIPFHIADDEIGEDAQYYLGRMHWIDAMTPPMYQRVDELVKHVSTLLGKKVSNFDNDVNPNSKYKLISKMPQIRDVFEGRDDLLAEIHEMFERGIQNVFLEGIGGIGKSELAKQYAISHKDDYDTVIFATYMSSLQSLLCNSDSIIIENLEPKKPDETDEDFFNRKLQVFQTISNKRTLIIIDNFDVDTDKDLNKFIEGNYHTIFTTRNAHPGYSSIKVEAMQNFEVLLEIFRKNYGDQIDESEYDNLKKIFELIDYHTYTVELIAKQMEASFLSSKEMLDLLENGNLKNGFNETISGRKDAKTAFGHICSVFNTSGLKEEDKQILRCLSLMGNKGVIASKFKEWMELDSFENINNLIHRSWIRKENGGRISLHPLVCEVVQDILKPTVENTQKFLDNITFFVYKAWLRPYSENLLYADNILSIVRYFDEIDVKGYPCFEACSSFLWQVGVFDIAIQFDEKLYEACKKEYGEDSPITAYIAKSVGGCYFNSRNLKESIPWYKKALDGMLKSNMGNSEDLAMCYEKVARCYTWEYEQNFEKANEYLNKALEIRQKNVELFEQGENKNILMRSFESWDLPKAQERIGETYMEMGRMYQFQENYEKALEYAIKAEEINTKANPNNVSGIAYNIYDQGVSYFNLGLHAKKSNNEKEAEENFKNAERCLTNSLETNMKMRGGLAVDTIDNQEILGDLYATQNKYAEASNAYMAVISMCEKLFGKDDERIEKVKIKMDFSKKIK